jgi:DNA polymerase V
VPAVVAYLDAYRKATMRANDDAPEPGTALALEPRPLTSMPTRKRLGRAGSSVQAGFPSPADDYMQGLLDLNDHLVITGHRDATFIVRVSGWSMVGAGIHDGDEVVVDRAITPAAGNVVVAIVNGDLTIKRLMIKEGKPVLVAENPHFKERRFEVGDELEIWGVATRVLHKL